MSRPTRPDPPVTVHTCYSDHAPHFNVPPAARPELTPPAVPPPDPQSTDLGARAPYKMPSSRTRSALAAVAVAALAASAAASAVPNRKLLQRPEEGEVLGAAVTNLLDLDSLSDIAGGSIFDADTLEVFIRPIAGALDAPLGAIFEPVYQFVGNNVPGFGGCL